MSDAPEGNICKVSANLGWASDTLAEVDKALLKLSAEIKTTKREIKSDPYWRSLKKEAAK